VSEGQRQRRATLVARPIVAAETIGRRIVSGNWQPGSVLPSFERLANEFAVSRLSVREAMRALAAKGLVESKPRRGTIVRPRNEWSRLDPDVLAWQIGKVPNAAFVRNLFEARAIIEPEAAALVARRATEDVVASIERAFNIMATTDPTSVESIEADVAFHEAILVGTGNHLLAAFAPAIGAWLSVAIGVQRASRINREHFVPQHSAILDAIKRGDAEGARMAFRVLLTRSEADAINGIRAEGKSDEQPDPR